MNKIIKELSARLYLEAYVNISYVCLHIYNSSTKKEINIRLR